MKFLKHRAFPSFYKDYAPKLIEFFGLWIDWLHEEGNAGYIVDTLSTEKDIDESVEAYKTHIKNKLLTDFPESTASDLKLLLKNIFYLYNSKSSIDSYEFLFRCLFDSPCTITYPKDFILKASDGRWEIPYYLQTQGFDILQHLDIYNWFKLEGRESGAVCYIDGADVVEVSEDNFISCLRIKNASGTFIVGEELLMTDPNTGTVYSEFMVEKEDGSFENQKLTVGLYKVDYDKGRWTDTHGLLSSDMMIQDSYYYQDFSYIIRSNVPMHKWKALVKELIHPAGLQFFGELMVSGTEESSNNPPIFITSPLAFLSKWHLTFYTYVLNASAKLEAAELHVVETPLVQAHSETMDKWTSAGQYHSWDGFGDINTGYANTFFNKNSVLMFRSNGTLIDPAIIDWIDFRFKEQIDTVLLHGTTLHPEKAAISGFITGSTWTHKYVDANIEDKFMVFTTQRKDNSTKAVREMRQTDKYLAIENGQYVERTVKEANMSTVAAINVDESSTWKKLTVKNYVKLNLMPTEVFDDYSFIKVPEDYVKYNGIEYEFTKRYYDEEKLVIFSYGDSDIREHFFFENDLKEENHTFTMQSATGRDYILCFIDGRFSNSFEVFGREIIIPSGEYESVEIYVLKPTEASRKLTEKYTGDMKFVYNNARIWPHMAYNTHIANFRALDYGHRYELPKDTEWRMAFFSALDTHTSSIHTSEIRKTTIAQLQSETPDDWLYYGRYYSSCNSYKDLLPQIKVESNANSTLLFTDSGKLISPTDIDWVEKKMLSDGYAYGNTIFSLPIYPEKNYYLEGRISGQVYKPKNVIPKNFFVFVDGVKVAEKAVSVSNGAYHFIDAQEGTVQIFEHSPAYVKEYWNTSAKELDISSLGILDDRYLIVFENGLLSHAWSYENGVIAFGGAGAKEVYLLNSYAYFMEDSASFNAEDKHFAFDNIRKMQYPDSASWIRTLKELGATNLALAEISSMELRRLAILKNKLSLLQSSMNLLHQKKSPVIPLYNTLDRELYDGNFSVASFEDLPIEHAERELNKFSTMLFDDSGQLINPNSIDWAHTAFNNIQMTDKLTSIVLNSEKPALIGELSTSSYFTTRMSEVSTDDGIMVSADEEEQIAEMSVSSYAVNDIENLTMDTISEMAVGTEVYYKEEAFEGVPHFVPSDDDFIEQHELVFVNGKKMFTSDYVISNGAYFVYGFNPDESASTPINMQIATLNEDAIAFEEGYVQAPMYGLTEDSEIYNDKNILASIGDMTEEDYIYINYILPRNEIIVFQYNPKDLDGVITIENSTNRFYNLPKEGYLFNNILMFKNGLLSKDYYLAGNQIVLNSLEEKDKVEIYIFKSFDYLVTSETSHNKLQKDFVLSNIKRLRYI